MSRIRVLLGDDHTILRETTAEVVNRQPDMCVVGQAATSTEVTALAQEKQPDVVVIDVAMSHLDGLKAARQIATDHLGCRVLVLTDHDDEWCIVQALEAGAIGYLTKTASLNELLEAIRAVARGESVLPPTIAAVVVRHMAKKELLQKQAQPLTSRELKVLHLAAQGLTNSDIAQQLYVSVRTVETHLTNVYNKIGVNSRIEAVVHAMQQGWLQPREQQWVLQ